MVTFGLTERIDTPIELMQKFHSELEDELPTSLLTKRANKNTKKQRKEPEPFTLLFNRYFDTAHQLKTQAVDHKGSVSEEQINLVKQITSSAAGVLGALAIPGVGAATFSKAAEIVVDGAKLVLSERDRIQQLLQQHQATRESRELQELMLDPLPKLTQAFAEVLIQRTERYPLILMLDTYEKAASEIDAWLCRSLLANTKLKTHRVRIVIAGCKSLLAITEAWRRFQQDQNGIFELRLERFDLLQTKQYLANIGIAQSETIHQIYSITKGLPYYLNWIRQQWEKGKPLNFSQGNQAIANLLFQDLNPIQKQIVQLAACCRWFNRLLLEFLVTQRGLDFEAAADATLNCFDWLKQQHFVESVQNRYLSQYRLDDVARDVFRLSLWQQDEGEQLQAIHTLLASYFEERSQKVLPDTSISKQYEDEDWRSCIVDLLYHTLFSEQDHTHILFISYLFSSRYLNQDLLVTTPFRAIVAESDLVDHPFLSNKTRKFLITIRPAVEYGQFIFGDIISHEQTQQELALAVEDIDSALKCCFSYLSSLQSFARFVALLYKANQCPQSQQLSWLQQCQQEAEKIASQDDPEFSSHLFRAGIGNSLHNLNYCEEAIACYQKAIEYKPEDDAAWNNIGITQAKQKNYKAAVISYDRALEIQPRNSIAWLNRGIALVELGRYEEAIASYDKVIELKTNEYKAWYNRGLVLAKLKWHEETVLSYDNALAIKPDCYKSWNNRGIALSYLNRHQEAIASYQHATALKPFDPHPHYNQACCYGLQANIEKAIDHLQQAIALEEQFREMAKTDLDFDSIRNDQRFQDLLRQSANSIER